MSNIGNKETMARNLQFYIEKSGKSQKDLAEIVGVAYSTFNDWVKGKKYPRIDKIEMLADYFRIQKSDLIEDKAKDDNSLYKVSVTEGERLWLELYNQLSADTREVLVNVATTFDKLPTDTQEFLLGAVRVALSNQK